MAVISRVKSGKREAGGRESRRVRAIALCVTAAVAVVGIGAGIIVAVRSGGEAAPAPAAESPARQPAGSGDSLAAAARALGFRQTTAPDVGVVENLPADITLLAPSSSMLPVGREAPDFTLATPTGERVQLSAYRGRTVLLEFFATWCPHCQAEARHLISLFEALPTASYAFVSVNADSEDAASLYAFDHFFSIPWPTLLDPGTPAGSYKQAGGAGPVTKSFGIALYPAFYIIDPKGRIAWRSDREQPDALILKRLKNVSGT